MSFMKYIYQKTALCVLAGLGLVMLNGCERTEGEISDILHESAKVVEVIYSPKRHGEGISPQVTGILSDDGPSLGFEITSIDMPDDYAVVFECVHGKFVSRGTDERHRNLWSRLKEGQEVDITYREVYKTTYGSDKDGDGRDDIVQRVLTELDFLDAQPKK